MRETIGDEKTEAWLEGLKANDVKTYEGNGDIAAAVADGEVDTGLVNHYYLYELLAETRRAGRQPLLQEGRPGALRQRLGRRNPKAGKNQANAQKFIEFLLSEGQAYFADRGRREGVPGDRQLPGRAPRVAAAAR